MREIRDITYGSEEYLETLELRNRVMRIPLGLDIHKEDFSHERESAVIGSFDGGQLLGVGVMSHKDVFQGGVSLRGLPPPGQRHRRGTAGPYGGHGGGG